MNNPRRRLRPLSVAALLACLLSPVIAAEPAKPAGGPMIKGGEHVLFIGNSLTGNLDRSLNTFFKANDLPAFQGHRLQIWNQTFETHCTISIETHKALFYEPQPDHAKGYRVKGACTFWKMGQYDKPQFNDRGYILASEAIAMGTPDGKPWDLVILQGYAAGRETNKVVESTDGERQFEGPFLKYGRQLITEVKKAGAKPVLYMNWLLNPEKGGGPEKADSYYNQNFDRLIANYRLLSEATGAPIIPVGQTMRVLSHEAKPKDVQTGWLIRDNVHGSASGRALLHYTIGAALSGRSAADLRYSYTSKTKWDKGSHYVIGEPEHRYNITITEAIDQAIRREADRALRDYGWLHN